MKNFQETINLLNDSCFYYIITTDMQGRYSYINNHYRKAFSHIHGEIVGQPYHITMHPDDTQVCQEVAAKCFNNPSSTFPATIRKHDGKGGYVITQWEYKAMFDDNNHPAGVFCLGYDITQYSMQQQELKSAQSKIEKSKEVLKEIAYNQSHVIRRPLANVIGLISILDRTMMDYNQQNIFDMIMQSVNELDEVIKQVVNQAYEDRVFNEKAER